MQCHALSIISFFFSKKEIGESEKYFQKINPFINLRNRDKKKKNNQKTHTYTQTNPQSIDLINWNEQFKLCFFFRQTTKTGKDIIYVNLRKRNTFTRQMLFTGVGIGPKLTTFILRLDCTCSCIYRTSDQTQVWA